MNCKYCDKLCKNKNSLVQHEIRCSVNPDKLIIKSNFIEYNKKLKSGEIVKKFGNQFIKAKLENREIVVSESTRQKLSIIGRRKKYTNEQRIKKSEVMQAVVRKYPDSYSASNVNGRTKKIEYNGILLDGSWEFNFACWCDKNGITWERPKNGFEYVWNGNKIYYPDFYLPEINIFVEVKGFERPRDIAKWSVVDNLAIIRAHEIKKIKLDTFTIEDLRTCIPSHS